MQSDDDKVLFADARLGTQVELFLSSEVGRYLVGRAEEEEKLAIAELIEAKPNDFFANRDIRNRIAVTHMFRDWLADAVQAGIAAGVRLREQDETFEDYT